MLCQWQNCSFGKLPSRAAHCLEDETPFSWPYHTLAHLAMLSACATAGLPVSVRKERCSVRKEHCRWLPVLLMHRTASVPTKLLMQKPPEPPCVPACCCRALSNDVFIPRTVSRQGAATPIECLSEYVQMSDGNFFIPLSTTEGVTVTPNVTSFAACVELCSNTECQLLTYDYRTRHCSVRVYQAPVYEG